MNRARPGTPAPTGEQPGPVPEDLPVAGPPLVVGVDGSPDATAAAVWAGEEAVRRHRALLVLTVLPARGVRSAFLPADAAEEARRAVPGLAVSTAVRDGDPVEQLLEAARDAEALVVGRGRGALGGLALGSVAAELAARSVRPTVVVPEGQRPRPEGPVVVGVDGTPAGEAALGYAFAAADRESVPLVAVHVWRDLDDPEWSPAFADDADDADAEDGLATAPEAELLAERLAGWSATYPDVEVQRHLPEGRAAGVLVRWSDSARLLVLGTRGRRGLTALGRSVSRSVLGRAACPVAVVPPHDRA